MYRMSYRLVATGVTVLFSLCLWCNSTWAVTTPYDKTPAAVVTQDFGNEGIIWDYELANHFKNNPSRRGFVVAVLDFCHSGGFVNELSSLSNVYVATACDWDEYSWSSAAFGQKFMNESKTKKLHQAFEAAKAAVLKEQAPQEHQGSMGDLSLSYLAGDRAVLFSADDPSDPDPSFWQDITTARDALLNRAEGAWPKETIGAYFGDGTKKFDDGTRAMVQPRETTCLVPLTASMQTRDSRASACFSCISTIMGQAPMC